MNIQNVYFDQSFVEETRNFSFDFMAHCKNKLEIDETPLHFAALDGHSKNCLLHLSNVRDLTYSLIHKRNHTI